MRLAPFESRTIRHMLESRVRDAPSSPVLHVDGRTLTAAELNGMVNRAANGLMAHGVTPGSTTCLLSPGARETIVTWLALAKIGAVCVPINVALRAPQIAYILDNSLATSLLVDRDCVAEIGRIDARLEHLERTVVLRTASAESMVENASEVDPLVPIDPTGPASILYTGGTTGPAKGVLCSHSHYYWWAYLMARGVALREDDVWLTCLPFFHSNAQATFLATVLAGASTAASGRFSASRFWQEARQIGATIGSILGTMAHILYHKAAAGPADREHPIRTIFCPAMPAAIQLDFEKRFGVKTINAYGSTELNCVTITPVDEPTRPGSMGRVLPEFEMRVVDEHDHDVPPGTPGELVVRPQQPFSTMLGYFALPEQTVHAWRNLWFHTGDRGVCNEDGHFYFVDRLKDCIRRRGENIASFEVEQVINSHAAVLESAAYPVPAEVGEDDVMVSVVPRPGSSVDVVELIRWCEARLPYFAIPRFLEIVDALPKTAVGRVEKYKLRQRGVQVTTWDREAAGYPLAGRPLPGGTQVQ
jgi:carnitine-CoA ligase